jgi:antitoxin CptB
MTDDIEMRRRRAAYRAAHRGTKELDFILGRFAAARLPAMGAEELLRFERLLALPDPVIAASFSHGPMPEAAEFAELVAALRVFHGLEETVGPSGSDTA